MNEHQLDILVKRANVRYYPIFRGYAGKWERFQERGKDISFDTYKQAQEYLRFIVGETAIQEIVL